MAAATFQCLSSSCFALPSKLRSLSINGGSRSSSLSYSASLSPDVFPKGIPKKKKKNFFFIFWTAVWFPGKFSEVFWSGFGLFLSGCLSMRPGRRSVVVVCETAPTKKADSAAKRARQAEKRRVYNKARKSEIKTRMKKVFLSFFLLSLLFCWYSNLWGFFFLCFL